MLTGGWFVDCCKEITTQKKNIWVAYSGGLDSHVLLTLAAANLATVRAVHVNHASGPNDDLWQQHCEQVCKALNVELHCVKVNSKPNNKQSPEDAARIARRRAWQDLLGANDVLLLAHHAEDQAETILYRLFRGTGPKGLRGMLQHSRIGEVALFRPLLTISKQKILAYAHQQKLVWVDDETNADVGYSRNFIRNQVMPLLAKRWPAATNNINRAGDLCGQLLQVVNPVISEKLTSIHGADDSEIDLNKLQNFSDFLRIELLRAWLHTHHLNPSLKQINLIQKQVIAAKVDANPKFVVANKLIRRSNNKLYILDCNAKEHEDKDPLFKIEWDLNSDLELPDGTYLRADQFSELKTQKIVVKIGQHGRKAKKIFQQHNIPPWERAKYPLIFVDGKLINIVGLIDIKHVL